MIGRKKSDQEESFLKPLVATGIEAVTSITEVDEDEDEHDQDFDITYDELSDDEDFEDWGELDDLFQPTVRINE